MGRANSLDEAVSAIFVAMRDSIYRYLLGSTDNPGEAEDMTQEVFLRLHAALDARLRIENLRAWLFRVAHNLAVDSQRRRERTGAGFVQGGWAEGGEPADPAQSTEERLLADERTARIEAALCRLSPQERHCLELRAEGLRYREIAQILGVGISTVQTFLERAVRKLESSIHD